MYTAVYMAMYTAVYMAQNPAVYTVVNTRRVHRRVRAVYTAVYVHGPVYTARTRSCTGSCTRVHGPYTVVKTARVHGHVHDRVHGRVHIRPMYTAVRAANAAWKRPVYTVVYTACTGVTVYEACALNNNN